MNVHWGKNGPWYKNIAVGLLLYSGALISFVVLHLKIGRPLQLLLFYLAIAGMVILLSSILYNFARIRHCVNLSRSLERLLDAGRVTLPEYLQRQMLLAAEIQRLDSLTKP